MRGVWSTVLLGLMLAAASPAGAAVPVNGVLAQVEDSVILQSDLDQAIEATRARLTAQGGTVPSEARLRQDVLDQLILRQVQLTVLQRVGGMVDSGAVDEAMLGMAQQRNVTSLSDLQMQMDAQRPGSYEQLRRQVMEDLSINRLRQQRVGSRVRVSDRDIDNFLKSPESRQLDQPEYRFNQVVLERQDPAALKTMQQVAQQLQRGADIEQLTRQTPGIKGGGSDWIPADRIPAPLRDALSGLRPGQASRVITIPGGYTVLQLMQSRGGTQTLVTQRQARHILVKTSDVVSPANAQAKLTSLISRLKAGEPFDKLARTYSDDPGSARQGGELGWVSAGDTVPAFEQALFTTPVGQLSAPVQSPYGWHVILVENERQQDMTEAYRRGMARQILSQRQFARELQDWLREIRAAAYVKINDPASVS